MKFTKCSTIYCLEKTLMSQALFNADLWSAANMLFKLTLFKNVRTSYRTSNRNSQILHKVRMDNSNPTLTVTKSHVSQSIFFLPQNYFPLLSRQMTIHHVYLYFVLYFYLSYPQVKMPVYNRQMQHCVKRKLSPFSNKEKIHWTA